MTKTELIRATAQHLDMKAADVKRVMETMCATIQEAVISDDPVSIPGFGKFVLVRRAARMGHNPATGAKIKIPAKKKLTFRPAKAWKDRI